MKITVDIDCTPEEARTFLGLPDMAPIQEDMTEALRARMRSALDQMNPEQLMRMWFPAGAQNWEQIQKQFWEQFSRMGMQGAPPPGGKVPTSARPAATPPAGLG